MEKMCKTKTMNTVHQTLVSCTVLQLLLLETQTKTSCQRYVFIRVSTTRMLRRFLILTIFALFILKIERTVSFKTIQELKKQFKKVEKDDFTTSDVVVGKAMDFIYSNKTIMSLIARELWDVGSRAIDRIVELKG